MNYWTGWYQPADIIVDVPLIDIGEESAWGTTVSFPEPDSDAVEEIAALAQRGDLAIVGSGTPTTLSDVTSATVTGGKHFDDNDDPGPNYVITGLSQFPGMGVGFASEYSIPTGPFDPAYNVSSQSRTVLNILIDQDAAYLEAGYGAFDDPALAELFGTALDNYVETRLFEEDYTVPSSTLVSGELLYHLEPETDTSWTLNLHLYSLATYLGDYAFWHQHGTPVVSRTISDNTVVDGTAPLPTSVFPPGYLTVPGPSGPFGTSELYYALAPYQHQLSAVHQQAASGSAVFATGPGEGLTNQHTQLSGLIARVTMRPARIQFLMPGDPPVEPEAIEPALRLNQRDDDLGIARSARLAGHTDVGNGPSSLQRQRAPRLTQGGNVYR